MKICDMINEIVSTISAAGVATGPNGQPVTVADVISDDATYRHYAAAMARLGIVMIEGRPGRPRPDLASKDYIFLDLLRMKGIGGMLRGTEVGTWPQIDKTLLMIQGSGRAQVTVGKGRRTGVRVPAEMWHAMLKFAMAEPADDVESAA